MGRRHCDGIYLCLTSSYHDNVVVCICPSKATAGTGGTGVPVFRITPLFHNNTITPLHCFSPDQLKVQPLLLSLESRLDSKLTGF